MTEAVSDSKESGDAQFPRVLFLTPHAFNKVTGTGITFTNLFAGWPKDRIATVHDDTFPVSTEVCERYYRLSGREIRRRDFGLSARLSRPRPTGTNEEPTASASGAPRLRTQLKTGARQWLFGDGFPQTGVLTPELEAWIADFRPDLIFTILGSIGMMELIGKIQGRFALPLVVHFMDDWPSALFRRGLLAPFQRHRMESLIRGLVDTAAVRMGICDAMCEAFEARYGRPFVPFQNTVDTRKWGARAKDPATLNDPVRVVYAGSILPHAQLDSLADCCAAIAGLANSGTRIRLDIYSPPELAGRYRSRLEVHPSTKIHGPLTDDETFFSTLQNADILLMPSNFDESTIRFIRYSMPTRVPAYLASGSPILVYGPPQVAQVRYAQEAGWGLVVDQRNCKILERGIILLTTNETIRKALSTKALSIAEKHHDSSVTQKKFGTILKKTYTRRTQHLLITQRVNSAFDRWSAHWGAHYTKGGQMSPRIRRFGGALAERAGTGAAVLDFGCGSGEITRALAEAGWQMTGCDASAGMIERAEDAGDERSIRWVKLPGGGEVALPFAADTFDAAFASSVFEYLAEPAAQAAEICRVLKPGGWFLLTVPDLRDPVRRTEARKNRLNRFAAFRWLVGRTRWRDEYEYLRISANRWPADGWVRLLTDAGFVPEPAGDCEGPLLLLAARKSE